MKKSQKKFSAHSANSQKNPKESKTYKQNLPKKSSLPVRADLLENKRTNLPPRPTSKNNSIDDNVENLQVRFFHIQEQNDGQRLDNFLLTQLKGVPKSHLYKLIRDGQIRLNKKRVKPMDRLTVGDVLRVAPIRLASRDVPIVSEDLQKGLLGRIVFENDGLIVLDKPFGLAVHGGSGESFGVIEGMRVAMAKPYLELVHRIDKETSGLLMIAKKRSTLKDLQERLREKTIQKSYLAIVDGHLGRDEFVIDKPLLKYLLDNGERRVKVSQDYHAKPSVTSVKVLAKFVFKNQPVSLIECQPKTGRTHQIRVHLASVGHPLLGDEKYHLTDKSGVRRLCLHAWRLQMADYEALTANLPSDFLEILAGVGGIDELLAK